MGDTRLRARFRFAALFHYGISIESGAGCGGTKAEGKMARGHLEVGLLGHAPEEEDERPAAGHLLIVGHLEVADVPRELLRERLVAALERRREPKGKIHRVDPKFAS
jgi:hypothetical protein